MLWMLAAMAAMNQLDRQLLNILVEPIRQEFKLSDVQIGLLIGPAFVLMNAAMSVPVALLAVRLNRRNLLVVFALAWGATTMLFGLAQSYAQLLLARLGVGLGEAGGMPPSHAMISDVYKPGERATAMAIWSAGINIGAFLAFFAGGAIGYAHGWRTAFLVAGAVTIALALLIWLTVPEPSRADSPISVDIVSVVDRNLARRTLAAMLGDSALVHIWIGATIAAVVGYATLAWIPSYIVRSHGLTIAQAGTFLALVVGLGGAVGTWAGGRLFDILRRVDVRRGLWLIALVMIIAKPFYISFLLMETTVIALLLFIPPAVLGAIYVGPSVAVLHDRVEARLRPIASAIFLLVLNFIGLGVGPLIVGAMSQHVFAETGQNALRYSLFVMQLTGLWGALHYIAASRALGPERAV